MADEERRDDKIDRMVWEKRYDEALRSGMDAEHAVRFADSDVDVGELRRLVEADCPADLLAGVLL